MSNLLGEFDGTLDAKGRLQMPVGILRQMPNDEAQSFVVNRGFERNLTLYPFKEWQRVSERVNRLNLFVQKNRQFARAFYRGATELRLDAGKRILLPQRLLAYAGIEKKVVLLSFPSFIEIWDTARYEELFDLDQDDFASLAEDIMGELGNADDDTDDKQGCNNT